MRIFLQETRDRIDAKYLQIYHFYGRLQLIIFFFFGRICKKYNIFYSKPKLKI